MNINFNLKRKFNVNGKEYNSIEEMPPEIRTAFEKAMALHGNQTIPLDTRTTINFNGKEYQSIDEMPPDTRKLYEKVLNMAQTGEMQPGIFTHTTVNVQKHPRSAIEGISSGPTIGGDTSVSHTTSKSFFNSGTENMGTPIKAESTFSLRSLVIGFGVIALIVLLYFILQWK